MEPILSLIMATLFATTPATAAAKDNSYQSPPSTSVSRDVNDNARAGDLQKVAYDDRNRAVDYDRNKAKRRHAVARCNDRSYSYSRRHTCQGHGGIRVRYR